MCVCVPVRCAFVCVCTRLHEYVLCTYVHRCICMVCLISFRCDGVMFVCFSFRCGRAKVSFMLITRIINDTRLILNLYRYFLDVEINHVFVQHHFWCDVMRLKTNRSDLILSEILTFNIHSCSSYEMHLKRLDAFLFFRIKIHHWHVNNLQEIDLFHEQINHITTNDMHLAS